MSADRKPDPQLGGAREELIHERASATPQHAFVAKGAPAPHADDAPPVKASLRELQTWFAAVVTHPESVEAGIASTAHRAERVVTPSAHLSVQERLGIYHYGYRARLIECLADDYGVLQKAIGEDAFEALAGAYVVAHPSTAPSLNFYGRHMPSFVRTYATSAFDPTFAADLATLEWALVETLHAAAAPTLSLEQLSRVPPAQWSSARLPKADTVRVHRFSYPVNAYLQAVRTGGVPDLPAPAPTATAIYRSGFILWRMDLTPVMARLLESLFSGATLGEALSRIETDESDPDAIAEAERSVMAWFREWVSGGFFARIALPSPT
jgi:hypothetical protein